MEQLKQDLLKIVNESGLPLEAIYYLVKDLFRDVDDAYQQALKRAAAEKAQKENTPEGDGKIEEIKEEK